MPEYLAPGVYVEETSFRPKSIEGVSTTTTGFIGPARYGPVHLEPDIVTSLSEFERTYGDGGILQFDDFKDAPNFLWHATRAFFNEGGKRVYISRVFRPLEGDYAPISEEFVQFPKKGSLYRDGHARAQTSDTGSIRVRARFPGAAGNLRVRLALKGRPNLLGSTIDPITGRSITTLGTLADRDLVWIRDITSPPDQQSIGSLYRAYWNEDSAEWEFEAMGASASDPRRTVAQLFPDPEPTRGDSVRVVTLTLTVLSRDGGREVGTWADLPLDPGHVSGGAKDSVFARFAPEPNSSNDARNLPIVIANPDTVTSAFDALTQLFGTNPLALLELDADDVARNLTPADKLTRGVSKDVILDGGNDGLRPGAKEYEGEADDDKDFATGLMQFVRIEDISMLSAPGLTWRYGDFRNQANSTMASLISHAERMRYRIAVLDSAEDQTIADVRNMRGKLDSKYAALYYPWVTVLDPITRTELNLPPSGFVTGIYARNDIERAVYKAPANEVVRSAIGFEALLNKSQQDILNPEGINCFRFFEGRGFRLWGARTISSDPEWKYVNVRRYFIYLERSIDKGTQWAVFEPNGERLWANVRRTVEDFLLNEWQNGALLGDKPEKAYFVKCDRSTMSQNDLDNGRLVCLIGVAPLKPAEFVIFRIGQWTADSKV